MTSEAPKRKGRNWKNVTLGTTTIVVILLLIVVVQVATQAPLAPTAQGTDIGNRVSSTTDWQGLAWGETWKLAQSSNGTLYTAYRSQERGGQGYKAYVDFSKDHGVTWAHLGSGAILSGTQISRVPALAIGSNDVLQVVWYGEPGAATGGVDRQIWYSRWLGNAWSTAKIIPVHLDGFQQASDPAHWQEHPDIIVDRFDPTRVYVVWEGTDMADLAIGNCRSTNCDTPMFTMSTDTGNTWSSIPGGFNGTYYKLAQPNAQSHSRPCIVQDSNAVLHVTWYGSDPGQGARSLIHYVTSADAGATWSSETAPIPANYGSDQRFPSMAADSHGRVYLVWKEKNALLSQNQTLFSFLYAGTWSTPIVIHPDQENQLNAAVQVDDQGAVYVGWNTGGPFDWSGDPPSLFDGSQIWLAKLNGTAWSAKQVTNFATNRFVSFPVGPMKASTVQMVWIEGNSPKPYSIKYTSFSF
ncbi:MAG TPA: sialidase family protein [Candidatus Bathyarchaeia archaeon]|nr:sialidase family protein [Candidatus Bathyarchaeia archaeon]